MQTWRCFGTSAHTSLSTKPTKMHWSWSPRKEKLTPPRTGSEMSFWGQLTSLRRSASTLFPLFRLLSTKPWREESPSFTKFFPSTKKATTYPSSLLSMDKTLRLLSTQNQLMTPNFLMAKSLSCGHAERFFTRKFVKSRPTSNIWTNR